MNRLLWLLCLLAARPIGAQTLYEREPVAGGVEIHFDLDSVGPPSNRAVAVRLPGELNGRRITYTLDTGATVNLITPAWAEAFGLRLTGDSAQVEGTAFTEGQTAVAEVVSIGNLTLHRVPFYVIDVMTGDSLVDRHLQHMRCMLGWPVLDQMGKATFDFGKHRLTGPRKPKRKSRHTRRSNLSLDGRELTLTLKTDDAEVQVIPDFGATQSALGGSYFEAHPEVALTGDSTVVYFGGVGGLVAQTEYHLPDFAFTLNKRRYVLPRMFVYSGRDVDNKLGMDFFPRQRRVTFDLRRWRLTIK